LKSTFPLHCAARNRFLAAIESNFLNSIQQNTLLRKQLWGQTGIEIIKFFKTNGEHIELKLISNILQAKKDWRENNYTHAFGSTMDKISWPFMQIAEMGMDGLEALFAQWNTEVNVPMTLDLSGSLGETPGQYITTLTQKMTALQSKE